MARTFKFCRRGIAALVNPDRCSWRSISRRNPVVSLERAAEINGFDEVWIRGRRYSLQSDQGIRDAARAFRGLRLPHIRKGRK